MPIDARIKAAVIDCLAAVARRGDSDVVDEFCAALLRQGWRAEDTALVEFRVRRLIPKGAKQPRRDKRFLS